MKKQVFPKGWNEKRVRKVIAHYDKLTDEELAAEDVAAFQAEGQTTMVVPTELVPKILRLIARHENSA
jgi:hypothetical protein